MLRTFLIFIALWALFGVATANSAVLFDSTGNEHTLPESVDHIICSGSGSLRLLSYLQASEKVVAVDDKEVRKTAFEGRPYALATPLYKTLPVFGEFRGKDNPELILSLSPQPQLIFKTYSGDMGYDPEELQAKTGIPVVRIDYGNLGEQRSQLYNSLRIMGKAVGKTERAEAVISFIEAQISDLQERTADISDEETSSIFIGGVSLSGAHGFQSTEPEYPPFQFIHARNAAAVPGQDLSHADIAKEAIMAMDPDILLLDLATLKMGEESSGLFELRNDPAYRTLSAVKSGKVFGVLPYNWYSTNYGSILANAYYIGKLLYPDRFSDIDPAVKADEIYSFLVGKAVFVELNHFFGDLAFLPLEVN